jgi:HSP20 family molecular chaperone IbpA
MAISDLERWMWADACQLLERAERLHRQFFAPQSGEGDSTGWSPPVDIYETPREFIVFVALPGVDPADVAIVVDGQILTIRGQRKLPVIAKSSVIHRVEIPHGRFVTQFRIPDLHASLADRGFEHGCLFLRLQKLL